MLRRTLIACLSVALAAPIPALPAGALDPDVQKGIAQVEDGDYDGAILTLDNAARRLAADKTKAGDLSQAFLYLGIAYIGKGHEAAAKAKFREAIAQIKDLSLSADKFPPKVINLFEAAKEEAARSAPAPGAPTKTAAAPAPEKKGGGGKVLLIVAGLAAVGGGVAAAGGGGGSSTPPTTTLPRDTRISETVTGTVNHGDVFLKSFVATAPGELEANLTWQTTDIGLGMSCQDNDPPFTDCGGTYTRLTSTTARYTARVSGPKTYLLGVENFNAREVNEPFTLVIKHP